MKNRLHRIKNNDSVFGGVCQGLSYHYSFDISIIRLIAVLLIFTPFPSIFIYLILWAVLPKSYSFDLAEVQENQYNSNFKLNTDMSNQSRNGNMVGGLVLIILGAIFSFKTFFDINLFSYIKNVWPLVLIGLGVWIIIKEKDDDGMNQNNNNSGQSSGTNF